jgi:hypothetical protein
VHWLLASASSADGIAVQGLRPGADTGYPLSRVARGPSLAVPRAGATPVGRASNSSCKRRLLGAMWLPLSYVAGEEG